jgi:predicted RNase H-like nuclease (RuvC/YqgF family)
MTDIHYLEAELKEAKDKYRTRDQALEKAVQESLPSAQGLKELVAQAKADVEKLEAKLEAAQREAKLEAAQREAKLEAAQREAKLEAAQRMAKLEIEIAQIEADLKPLRAQGLQDDDPQVKDLLHKRGRVEALLIDSGASLSSLEADPPQHWV